MTIAKHLIGLQGMLPRLPYNPTLAADSALNRALKGGLGHKLLNHGWWGLSMAGHLDDSAKSLSGQHHDPDPSSRRWISPSLSR
jgi:hypothetical protein